MKFKLFYLYLLLISSIFYFATGLLDFTITMCGYAHYGDLFYQMELNQIICLMLKSSFPPIHMFLIPFTLICLTYYFHTETKQMQTKFPLTEIINEKTTWGILFAILLILSIGIIHLIGFTSWFYYGAF